MDRLAAIVGTGVDDTDSVFVGDDSDQSRPSSRASSSGRVSPALESTSSDMENVAWDDMPLEKLYELFAHATHLRGVMRAFEALQSRLELNGLEGMALFRSLKEKMSSQKTWKARDLLQLLSKRANQSVYMQQKSAEGVKVLIVGGGPVGLRLAIDCLLLGCDVRVIEKRSSFSRNNVLHLWPFTIEDLRQLGAKKFYGKFCAGAIDHICIRALQCILLKICLLLGLSFHVGVEFIEVLEPTADRGWHAKLNPSDHLLNEFDFDILVGADGRRSSVPGFDRKELRGKLALAITANFINYYTRDEAAVDEISGVAFIFNQKFFKDLKAETGIDLENIVYYKDDTHYFVMTAKKESLLKKGVLIADYPDTRTLLHPSNINKEELYDYSVDAAGWSTELPQLDFALNHYDEPDVALFDFTSIFQAEYAARAVKRRGKDLILSVVGDALLEPFWPTGTGIGRGFLSAQDTAWMIRGLGQGRKMLDLLCEREVIAQRLPQTTPERLQSNIKTYTINPTTRYCNLNLRKLPLLTVKHLYDTDTVAISPALQRGSIKLKSSTSSSATVKARNSTDKENDIPLPSSPITFSPSTPDPPQSSLIASPSREPLTEGSVNLAYYSEPDNKMSLTSPGVLLQWVNKHVEGYGIHVDDLSTSWSDGIALCGLIYRFHPELIPEFHQLSPANPVLNNQRAFSVAELCFGISPLLQPAEMEKPDKISLFTYLSLFYEFFSDVEPPEPLVTGEGGNKKKAGSRMTPLKRKATVMYALTPQSVERNWNTRTVKRQSMSPPATKLSNGHHDDHLSSEEPPKKKVYSQPKPVKHSSGNPRSKFVATTTINPSDMCYFCGKRVYLMERMSANGFYFHRTCFRCSHCNCQLKIGGYSLSKGEKGGDKGKFFCTPHYRQLFLSNPEAINYSRVGPGPREKPEEEPMDVVEQNRDTGAVKPVSRLDKVVEVEESSMETVKEERTLSVMSGEESENSSSDVMRNIEGTSSVVVKKIEGDWMEIEAMPLPSVSINVHPPQSSSSWQPEISIEGEDEREKEGERRNTESERKSTAEEEEEGEVEGESVCEGLGESVSGPEMMSNENDDMKGVERREVCARERKRWSLTESKLVSNQFTTSLNKKQNNDEVIRNGVLPQINGSHGDICRDSSIMGERERVSEVSRDRVHHRNDNGHVIASIAIGDSVAIGNRDRDGVSVRERIRTIQQDHNIENEGETGEGVREGEREGKGEGEGGRLGTGDVLAVRMSECENVEWKNKECKKEERENVKCENEEWKNVECENEEWKLVRDMELSTMQVVTSHHHGGVSFKRRPSAPSSVQQLTANYEKKERDKENSLVRSSRLLNKNRYRSRGGQKSIVRPMMTASFNLQQSDVMIQERRKQQKRFREAQSIQREMSQLERQNDEMEEFGRQIEQELRDSEGTTQEDRFMQSWLQLVNERNGLVRKITELSLRVKELELEDRQYEVDKELNEIFTIPEEHQTESQKIKFEELFVQKLGLVEERDVLVIQIDEDRKREQEEDKSAKYLLDAMRSDSVISRSSATGGTGSGGGMKRVSSAPNVRYNKGHDVITEEEQSFNEGAQHVETVLLRDKKRKASIKSWFGFSK